MVALRPATHDSGSGWFATPFLYDSFIHNSTPVYPGALRTLLIGSRQVQAVIEHPRVRAVTLTGSTPAGKSVASQAGASLKKTVLELGGSDPYVVLEDADLDLAELHQCKALHHCRTDFAGVY
jgi:acyl-CoA reductase-like NAD-dependent aldehyde dehydrogenase